MVDTHCHLTDRRLYRQIDEVLGRAKSNGVERIVVPGTDLKSSRLAVELAVTYEAIYAAVGWYPGIKVTSDEDLQLKMEELEKLLDNSQVVAIGECGLDAEYEGRFQKRLLMEQMKLANKYRKSLILHNRGMATELLEVLEREWSPLLRGRVVFHCCEPKRELLEFARQKGIYIGVDGDVTYDSVKQEFIREVPWEMLVLETDSPYLLPEPLKMQRKYPNEPANLRLTAEYLAKLKDIAFEEIDKIISDNAKKLFQIKD